MGVNLNGDLGPFRVTAPVGRYASDSAKGAAWFGGQWMKWSVIVIASPLIALYWLAKVTVRGVALAVPPLGRALETDDPVVAARRRRWVGYLGAAIVGVTALTQFARLEIVSGILLVAVASGVAIWSTRQHPRYA
jgi:hypothetical protein